MLELKKVMDFTEISYLQNGSSRQCSAYEVLSQYRIMQLLEDFDPILVGTVPINIDIENSDLDIICCCTDKSRFVDKIITHFANCENFVIRESADYDSVVINFKLEGFEIEIFSQDTPSRQQYGYRHMLIEYQLLSRFGEEFRQKVLDLKRQGYKTEPAFAMLLEIDGNPYEGLLKYEFDQP